MAIYKEGYICIKFNVWYIINHWIIDYYKPTIIKKCWCPCLQSKGNIKNIYVYIKHLISILFYYVTLSCWIHVCPTIVIAIFVILIVLYFHVVFLIFYSAGWCESPNECSDVSLPAPEAADDVYGKVSSHLHILLLSQTHSSSSSSDTTLLHL